MMMGAIGLGVALALVLAFGLYRDVSPDATPPARSAAPTPAATHPATAYSARRPTDPWTALPAATIPVTSPDDLPRAADAPPGIISHRPAPPVRSGPAGRTGLLTVFCTPACDAVTDGARALGPSPVFKVPANVGVHRLRLRVDALSVEKTVSVTVRENDTTVVRENIGE
jgi:hypothetical protein